MPALSVSARAQILQLLAEPQVRLGRAHLCNSHDLGSVRFISPHVAVMHLGEFLEISEVDAPLRRPGHHSRAP
ncbi:MAG: hypothetical protein K5Q68_07180 [Roseococcus sp.]|nr:hypothetical protein [Roseococcus sp.]